MSDILLTEQTSASATPASGRVVIYPKTDGYLYFKDDVGVETRINTQNSNTAAGWTAANPTLAAGVFGVELDTMRFKIGDGTTPWNSLAYWRYTAEHITISTTGGTTVLTIPQSRASSMAVAGALVSNAIIVTPDTMALFVAENNTTGAFTVTFKTAAGTGIVVPQGAHVTLYADGVNIENPVTAGAGSGDVVGPSSAVGNNFASYNGITGKIIKDSGSSAASFEPANANIQSHIANTSNPHSVTKTQVGLGNCDNTSDVNKPVSTAQAAADTAAENNAKAYADTLVLGLLDDRGNYDASVNTFPASGGSGTAGAVMKGDVWRISVAGTLGGEVVAVGDAVRALSDAPGQTASNWAVMFDSATTAAEVTNIPAGSIVATTVQAAINELDSEKMAITTYDVDADGVVDLAETVVILCRNTTGVTISKMAVVYISGATGQNPIISLAKSDAEATSSKTIGVVTADITNNATGFVALLGELHDYDTSAFTDGDTLWLSATVAGGMTATRPPAPNHAVLIGFVAYSHANNGKIALNVTNGQELDELHDVLITSVADNQVLQYDSASGTWKNRSTLAGLTFTAPALGTPTSGDLRNCSLAVAPAIGGTTPNSVAATALSASGIAQFNDSVSHNNGKASYWYEPGTTTWLRAYSPSMNEWRLGVTSGDILAVNTVGLAVTGAISATSIQNTPIGSTTPAAGAFTTLSANTIIYVDDGVNGRIKLLPSASTNFITSTTTAEGAYKDLRIQAGSAYTDFTNTGLSVTGTISATGNGSFNTGGGSQLGFRFSDYPGGGVAAIYNGANVNHSANYAIASGTTTTYINGSASSHLQANSVDVAIASSTGLAVTGTISATTSILSSGATSGIGYTTGAGGTVTQATSRTTGVTLNKINGEITLVSAAGSASWQSFTVTNSAMAATDHVVPTQKSGTDKYLIHATNKAAGSFELTYATTGGTTTEQPVFGFEIHKGVAA